MSAIEDFSRLYLLFAPSSECKKLAHGLFGSTRVPISSSEDGTDMFQFSVVDTCSKTCSMSSDVNVKFTCQGVGISLSSLPCYHSVHQSEFYCLSSVKIKCIKYDSFQVLLVDFDILLGSGT